MSHRIENNKLRTDLARVPYIFKYTPDKNYCTSNQKNDTFQM